MDAGLKERLVEAQARLTAAVDRFNDEIEEYERFMPRVEVWLFDCVPSPFPGIADKLHLGFYKEGAEWRIAVAAGERAWVSGCFGRPQFMKLGEKFLRGSQIQMRAACAPYMPKLAEAAIEEADRKASGAEAQVKR